MRRTCAPLAALPLLLALAAPAPGNAQTSRPAQSSTRAAAWQTIAAQSPALAWLWGKVGSLIDPESGGKNGITIDPSGFRERASHQRSLQGRAGSNAAGSAGTEKVGSLVDPLGGGS